MSTLNNSRPKPIYPGGQQELYTLIETGWGSYVQYLPDFTNKKSTYTQQTADDQLAALAAARAMPDETSREEVHKTLRKKLVELTLDCLEQWSFLDSYIMDAFDEENYEDKRMAAGHVYYRGAQQKDWDSVKGLMSSGKEFIAANAAVLGAEGGMPATFPAEFDALKADFETHHQAFLHAEEDAKRLTDLKIEANNALYKALSKMFADGQRIFRKQPTIREQFMVDRVMKLIGGSGGGSNPAPGQTMKLTGNVTHAVTAAPLPDVEVTVIRTSGNFTVFTDAAGNYAANGIQLTTTESVQVRFRHTAMNERIETTDLIPGQDKVLNVTMTPSTVFFGNVTDNLGNTLVGATVRFSNAEVMLEVQTDSNGNYRLPFSGLTQPQSGTLTAMEASMMPSSRPVTITPGEQQEQNFMLSPMAPPPPMP